MVCARCGAPVYVTAVRCAACGTPAPASTPQVLARPALVTLLAAMQFVGGAACISIGLFLGVWAALADASAQAGDDLTGLGGLLLAGLGALQVACGLGLWKLRAYGRSLQRAFAWIGLIGIPIGTVVSVLILRYLRKPGVEVLFSGKAASEVTPDEWAQVGAIGPDSRLVVVVWVVAALALVGAAGTVAAIEMPSLIRGTDDPPF